MRRSLGEKHLGDEVVEDQEINLNSELDLDEPLPEPPKQESSGDKEEEIFLGREIAQHRDYSESTAQEVDEEVRRLVKEAHEKAREILTENLQILHNMAEALLEHETLDEKYIDIIISGGSINGKDSPIQEEKETADESVDGNTNSGESAESIEENPDEAVTDDSAEESPDSDQKD